MKNKNELMDKELENSKKYKKIGLILICVGFALTVFNIVISLIDYFGIKNSISPVNSVKIFKNMSTLLSSAIVDSISIGLIVAGVILMVINDNKIKKDAEKVIPKAKETLNKAEPVVTDVIKTVGEGIEDIAHNVKETIDKNKNNKKGE